MAMQATHIAQDHGFFHRFIEGLFDGLVAYGERNTRQAEFDALNAKTDEELKQMGLTRDRIVMHVFREMFYV